MLGTTNKFQTHSLPISTHTWHYRGKIRCNTFLREACILVYIFVTVNPSLRTLYSALGLLKMILILAQEIQC